MVSGTGASAGIGIGRVVILKEETLEIKRETIADAEAEKARFKKDFPLFPLAVQTLPPAEGNSGTLLFSYHKHR